jgi:hypothetical protein
MPFEAQLIEAARLVREWETRHALVHVAAIREAGRIRRRPRLVRLSGRITRPLRLRAQPVPTGSALTHATIALD